jgi:hypothetical protein
MMEIDRRRDRTRDALCYMHAERERDIHYAREHAGVSRSGMCKREGGNEGDIPRI